VNPTTPVAIVGAGPYGLSLAAHLAKHGVPFRIFGPPMQVWQEQMPKGMQLKSDGFASDLYDPDRNYPIRKFCAEQGIAYNDWGIPVRLDTFVKYGHAFQKKHVPMLETIPVVNVSKTADGFEVSLENGERVAAHSVVMATGISFYDYVPESLAGLPAELCTHSHAHSDVSRFRGKRVAVIGGGASATDLAAELHDAGAAVTVVTRNQLEFHLPPSGKPRSLWQRLTKPNLGLGPSFRNSVYIAFPGIFCHLPKALRHKVVARALGPSGGWFIKDRVIGKVTVHVGYSIEAVQADQGVVKLQLVDRNGGRLALEADHVIACTGYRPAVSRMKLIDPQLQSELRCEGPTPRLSRKFESSVPGLYFIGVTAANTFGPVMRFALGAGYAAPTVGAHLRRLYGQK
jgi:thioredoxin reductase